MARSERRGIWWRVLPLVLLVPLVVVPTVAYPRRSRREAGRRALPVAQPARRAERSIRSPATSSPTTTDARRRAPGAYSCLEQAFGNIAYRARPARALDALRRRSSRPTRTSSGTAIGSSTPSARPTLRARTTETSRGRSRRARRRARPATTTGSSSARSSGSRRSRSSATAARELCVGVGIRGAELPRLPVPPRARARAS